MNISIDTGVFVSLLGKDEDPAGKYREIWDVFLNIWEGKELVWVIHRRQIDELLCKTKELIEEESLHGEDQENAKEFFGYLVDLECLLVRGDPAAYKISFGNPEGVDVIINRKAAVAGEIAGYITKMDPAWKLEKVAATIVAFAMLEKASVLSAEGNSVGPMVARLNKLHAEALPPIWVQRFRDYREFPRVILTPKSKS